MKGEAPRVDGGGHAPFGLRLASGFLRLIGAVFLFWLIIGSMLLAWLSLAGGFAVDGPAGAWNQLAWSVAAILALGMLYAVTRLSSLLLDAMTAGHSGTPQAGESWGGVWRRDMLLFLVPLGACFFTAQALSAGMLQALDTPTAGRWWLIGIDGALGGVLWWLAARVWDTGPSC